jgi:YD repeat-containing protein
VTSEQNTGDWSNAIIAGPTSVTDATSYVFDAAGRRVSQTVDNTSGAMTRSWTYDQRGLATSMTTPRGNASGAVKADFTSTYVNDEIGRLIKTVAPTVKAEHDGGTPADVQPTAMVGYGAFGQATSSKDALGNVSKSAFDKLGRTVEVSAPSYTPPGGSAVTPKTSFSYDAVGNLLQQVDERGNATKFAYDHLNQQVQADAPGHDERRTGAHQDHVHPERGCGVDDGPAGCGEEVHVRRSRSGRHGDRCRAEADRGQLRPPADVRRHGQRRERAVAVGCGGAQHLRLAWSADPVH